MYLDLFYSLSYTSTNTTRHNQTQPDTTRQTQPDSTRPNRTQPDPTSISTLPHIPTNMNQSRRQSIYSNSCKGVEQHTPIHQISKFHSTIHKTNYDIFISKVTIKIYWDTFSTSTVLFRTTTWRCYRKLHLINHHLLFHAKARVLNCYIQARTQDFLWGGANLYWWDQKCLGETI